MGEVVSSRLVLQLSVIYILVAPAIAGPKFLRYFCSDKHGNYSIYTNYKPNLSHLLSSDSADIGYGFYNSSFGETIDLSEKDCSPCLSGAIENFWKYYSGITGGRILTPSCNFRYQIYGSYDPTAVDAPPPPPSPCNCIGKKSDKSRTAIILVVLGVAFVVLAISIYIDLRVRKPREKPGIQSNLTSRRTSSSVIAPTLALSSQSCWDVFLSFRGPDTRKNFIDHLYFALVRAGIRTFLDDELPRGDTISTALLNAIRGSRISIVVFSKDYASSKWCLDELVEIVDCRITIGHTLLPIFYHMVPSDVRRQTGTFAEAFVKHEEQFQTNTKKVQKWREALTIAANCSGFDLESIANGYESRFIEKIVEKVLCMVNVPADLNVATSKE